MYKSLRQPKEWFGVLQESHPGQNVDQQPDDYVDVHHGDYAWEGAGKSKIDSLLSIAEHADIGYTETFPSTGVTVTWNLIGDPADAAENTPAGSANNGYESFWMYTANKQHLYSTANWDCSAFLWAY